MRNLLIKVLALFVLPAAAFAQPGSYIKGEAGVATMSDGTHKMVSTSDNPTGGAGRIAYGYLAGDNTLNYGVETGALYVPNATHKEKSTDASFKYEALGVDVLGVTKYNFNSGFVVFAKGGVAYLHEKATVKANATKTLPAYQVSESGHKFAPEAALGFGYKFSPQVEADLTATTIFAGKPKNNNPTTTTTTLLAGLTYNIG